MIKKAIEENKHLLLLIFAYILVDQLSFIQPYFRTAFKDNPNVSHFFVWFVFQLGFALILFTLLWKAPFRKTDLKTYAISLAILLSAFVRVVLILCVLLGAIGQEGLKVNNKFLYIFMNKGEFNVPFLGDYGLPNVLYYAELLVLIQYFISRVRNMVDNTYRHRYSIKTFHNFLSFREGEQR